MSNKLENLKTALLGLNRVLIAFSGGVDSTFLLYSAKEALGKENVIAVIGESPTYPVEEIAGAIEIADGLGVSCRIIKTEEFSDENFICNSKERCYFCKKELFAKLKILAKENGIKHVLDGSNVDDLSDHRPGNLAKEEFGVQSPLQEVGLTKEEIRQFSKEAGLPTWDKPSMACLASRIPYGTRIDEGILNKIREGEKFLRSLGFNQLRVRHHATMARIEIEKKFVFKIMEHNIMDAIVKKFEELGYTYVTVDLKGYRTGSMNEPDLS